MVAETVAHVQEPQVPQVPEKMEHQPPRNRGGRGRGRGRGGNRGRRQNPTGRMTYDDFISMADYINSRTEIRPRMAIICGSGLGPLAANIQDADMMPYTSIPGFPRSTVEGHAGELVFGTLGGVPVVAMKGRFHPYEGYPLWKVASPIRLFKVLGVKCILVSNAAGGLNPDFKVGDVMFIKDHLNFMGFANQSPLTGPNLNEFGPRFPSISKAYTSDLLLKAKQIFKECNNGCDKIIKEGVYTGLGGPTYETIAECRFLRNAGVDAVGMSTTQEVIAAAHCGIPVLGISLITNEVIMDYDTEAEANHEEVLETAKSREPLLTMFAEKFVESIKEDLLKEDPKDV